MIKLRMHHILLLAGGILGSALPAAAQDYPSKNVAIILHTGAGGPLDTLVRTTAEILTEELDWSVRVENRQGGNGESALNYVMSQPADGYTIQAITSALATNFALKRSQGKPEDLTFLTTVSGEQSVLAVRADSKYKTLEDYVAAVKASAPIRIGGSGQGGNDFAHFLLDMAIGTDSTWIPFDGAPEAVVALAGGHIDVAFLSPSSALSQFTNGDFRILASSGEKRLERFPDVPTLKESGYDVSLILWRGFIVKTGTPDDVVAKILDALAKVQATDKWKKLMEDQHQEALPMTREEFKALMMSDTEKLSAYYKAKGLVE